VPVKEKLVALTFDDGPSAEFTPKVLEILDRYQVKATFFLVGTQVVAYPHLARELVAAVMPSAITPGATRGSGSNHPR